jgi:hypothetical protein
MDTATTFTVLCALHFIGDFAFQSTWMAMEKGKSWEVLTYHVATYTAPFTLLMALPENGTTPIGLAVLTVTHFLEDAAKGRWGLIKSIWLDQAIHVAVLAILLIAGWM